MQNISPSRLTYPEIEDFDYGTFLQQSPGVEDGNLQLASPVPPQRLITTPQLIHQTTAPNLGTGATASSDSSLSKTTPPSSGNRSGSIDAATEPAAEKLTQRQRLERKGHTKSRRGCFNCKRRRIKCQETHPACGHCVKMGLKCEYPAAPQITHQVCADSRPGRANAEEMKSPMTRFRYSACRTCASFSTF